MRPVTNLNPVDILATLPAAAGDGAFIVTDPRGTRTDAFVMTSATGFYRLDLTSGGLQRLPNPPAGLTFGAGVAPVWDETINGIFVIGPGAGAGVDSWFARYTYTTGVWAPMNSATLDVLLPGTLGLDAALVHPCTTVGAAASDDFIYLACGANAAASLITPRYSKAGNAWAAVPPANRLVAVGAGATMTWVWGYSPDLLFSLDATGLATGEQYSIAGNAWAANTYFPPFTALPAAGTCACASPKGDVLYFRLNATGGIYTFNRLTNVVTLIAQMYGTDGTATAGSKMAVAQVDGVDYLLCIVNGSTQVQRIRVVR